MAVSVNAYLVTSLTTKSSHFNSDFGNTDLLLGQGLGGLRFPPKRLHSTNGRKRGEKCHNVSVRSAADNGSSSSNGSTSRMVPIEEALKGRSATFLSRRPVSEAKGTTNGAAKGSSNGTTYANSNGVANRGSNGSTNGSTNGRANSVAMSRQLNEISISKLNQSMSADVVIPKMGSVATVDVGKHNEGAFRVLPSDEGFSWARDDYSTTQRQIDVWSFVLTLRARVWFLDSKWTYLGGFTEEKQKARRRSLAVWVREKILQLGPTFIKLGQLSSTRSDLFPAEIVEELAKLQDRVPAFSAGKAMAFIEKELGAPVDALFADFERQPIAAASLGQVHRAILPNGERVVVKVQRPGLKRLFDIDLNNLKVIAQYFQNSESMGGPTRDWLGIYEECATILYQEIDYLREGRNADRFRRDFRKQKWVRVPQVFWDYASQKVLTLEYVPGIKINDVALLDAGGFDKPKLARLAIEAYLIQILRTGFFHADPHPGNLAVDADGSLIYYDFGMMGEIKSFTREKLLEMFYAVYEKDARKIIQALIDLGALVPTGDMGSVRRSVQYFLDNLMDQKPDQAATFSAIGEDLFAIAVDQPFRFPATFTFVLRAFSTLEGIGNTLDPDFSFAKIAAPYAQELLDTRNGQRNGSRYFVEELQRQANDARDATVQMPQRVQRVDQIMRQLESGDLKLRVRSLEAERAARRASVMQEAIINSLFSVGLANIGVTLSTAQGITAVSNSSFVGAGIFLLLLANNVRRIRNLDKFEKML
ncbi:protein ACTIVITY OF BC1 COMPLEX KINASE 7, chloroplastic [Physcomitrium patens]|uniref:ABC1 atypical kinase-like domain-containing protein n=1 Tax=Physcomitrium patens TaxID=3218 RepID=A0A2K1JCK0_PHYPA|nr:protein ACTIVITY OF BC1 COMPLEX KINASE 7, chloroplastic-like isoform X1 [Physcomitrium patens]PNR39254.1 hypothetical protein PHYPA_019532 [Physcomitrium patens]|eukprot:XP_024397314.1 protein ACTIVITY OF BC1 COMPLEX KINASE 7, chloroplastic-like isoform X1 [Physcomitrella patens]